MFRRFQTLLARPPLVLYLTNLGCKQQTTMSLDQLNFDNLALRSLPIDSEEGNRQRRVEGACFSLLDPTPVERPDTVVVSQSALQLIDLNLDQQSVDDEEFAEYLSGNKKFTGSQTASHCYCGHQFGYFSGQLGDGCAMYLGEVVNKKGERWEMQLKGSGKTPYSRTADGRKVLRSSIREFLCSEAMHSLGVPTTRAGSCVTSDTKVIRDIQYNGNPIQEKATIILRIAPTFLRFGSFEIFKPIDGQTGREGPSVKRKDILDKLLNYTIQTFYPQIWRETGTEETARHDMLIEFYEEVCRRTAILVAKWQCIGWCHGVLNTDNMSIAGITIDYGPYGFMDRFDPGFICNASDNGGRYSYENQPSVVRWNCKKLGEAIQMSLPVEKSEPSLKVFDDEYDKAYIQGIRKKFGLLNKCEDDISLISSFFSTMFETGCDFTNGFQALSLVLLPGLSSHEESRERFIDQIVTECAALEEIVKSHQPQINPRQLAMFMSMIEQQPELAEALSEQMALVKVELKRQEKLKSLKGMTASDKKEADTKLWKAWLEKYITRLKIECEDISNLEEVHQQRGQIMEANNPKIVLRNYMAQEAIEKAEEGDYTGVRNLLELLKTPYSSQPSEDTDAVESSLSETVDTAGLSSLQSKYRRRPPAESTGLIVT